MPIIGSRVYKKATRCPFKLVFSVDNMAGSHTEPTLFKVTECPLHKDMRCLLRAPCKRLRWCDVMNVVFYVYLIKYEAGQVDKLVTGVNNVCLKTCSTPFAAKILFRR
jgi:hypothetical protein